MAGLMRKIYIKNVVVHVRREVIMNFVGEWVSP